MIRRMSEKTKKGCATRGLGGTAFIYVISLRSIATSGVAARLTRIERALAQAVIDPGQRVKVGPSAGMATGGSSRKLFVGAPASQSRVGEIDRQSRLGESAILPAFSAGPLRRVHGMRLVNPAAAVKYDGTAAVIRPRRGYSTSAPRPMMPLFLAKMSFMADGHPQRR